MNYIGKVISNFRDFYKEINTATLTGAIDVIVVKQEDGDFVSSPFHVRFGKIGVLRSKEKVVDIEINGEPVDIHMKLGESGEAFFVEKVDDGEEISEYLGTSPLQSTCDLPSQLSLEASDVNRLYAAGAALRDQGPTIVCANHLKKTSSPTIPIPNSSSNFVHGRSKSVSDGNYYVRDDTSKDLTEGQKSLRSRRKKRRKINQMKKKSIKDSVNFSDGQSSENSTTSEVQEILAENKEHVKEMFFLEDLNYNVDSQSSQHSSSMPQLRQDQDAIRINQIDRVISMPYPSDLHSFSDTDISPHQSRGPSRCETPIKSDTECEIERHKTAMNDEASKDTKWSWSWGELPTPPLRSPTYPEGLGVPSKTLSMQNLDDAVPSKADGTEGGKVSMFGNMLSFMRKSKNAHHDPEREGVYLEDLNRDDIDPEIAALYFYKDTDRYTGFKPVQKNEDLESGNGASLPQSPQFSEDLSCVKNHPSDSDFDENPRNHYFDLKSFSDVAFSLCGKLQDGVDDDFPESIFLQNLVTYDNYCENPEIFDNPDLVVRMNNKYYNWATAKAEIMSAVLFRRPLPSKVFEELALKKMPPKEMRKITESKSYSWFSWRRNQSEVEVNKVKEEASRRQSASEETFVPSSSAPNLIYNKEEFSNDAPPGPIMSSQSTEDISSRVDNTANDVSKNDFQFGQRKVKYKKTLRLSPDEIKKLQLRYGTNEVVFSVTTAYQGTTKCKCNIFLWNYDEKIVISDIDGTITKSDVLGHILPIVGSDWAQCGVAQLFTKIKNNGYHFLYLSARAIGQARLTREYLKSVKQGDLSLPDGPVLLNPTSLILALHREVIEKKPEEFKISCLKDIQALFKGQNPFYAGYGNRINDVWAYCEVGIPISRVFTINHKGELKHELTQAFQTTYTNLSDIANLMFPSSSETEVKGDYSSINYWKIPLPDVADDIATALIDK